MRKSKFSETQIVTILGQQENGKTVGEICREYGITTSQRTLCPERCFIKKVVEPALKREIVAYVLSLQVLSERRSCQLIGISRRTYRYESINY